MVTQITSQRDLAAVSFCRGKQTHHLSGLLDSQLEFEPNMILTVAQRPEDTRTLGVEV
jgi:hypothetical protein